MEVKPCRMLETEVGDEPLLLRDTPGVEGGDCERSVIRPKSPDETGVAGLVAVPLEGPDFLRLKACFAACSRRLVVPNAFVEPDRAEHTIATLWESI